MRRRHLLPCLSGMLRMRVVAAFFRCIRVRGLQHLIVVVLLCALLTQVCKYIDIPLVSGRQLPAAFSCSFCSSSAHLAPACSCELINILLFFLCVPKPFLSVRVFRLQQHINNLTLLSMNRPPQAHTKALLQKLRDNIPGLVLRTTFIAGG